MPVSPDEVPLVSEASVALRALVGFLLRRRRDIGGVVVEVLVPLEKLLLPEALVTLIALERLLVRVDQHVALQVALGDRAVGAEVTLEALLTLVGLLVHFEGVPVINNQKKKLAQTVLISILPVRETFATHFTMHRLLAGVKLLDVKPQVCFPPASCRAKLALISGFVPRVDGSVRLQAVALREPGMTNVTLVGLFT